MATDPVVSNPTLYSVLFENERVRVLEYLDERVRNHFRTIIPTAS